MRGTGHGLLRKDELIKGGKMVTAHQRKGELKEGVEMILVHQVRRKETRKGFDGNSSFRKKPERMSGYDQYRLSMFTWNRLTKGRKEMAMVHIRKEI